MKTGMESRNSDSLELKPEILGDHKQPNILMIFSDQHNARMSGYMGHPLVRTPNLDRLASQGVTLTNAYCNSPLCSPSRQSFMAGLHCHEIEMWNNCKAMPENTVTWAHMLSMAGYETSLVGKMHFNGYQKMYGFDRRPVLEGNNSGQQFYSWGQRTSHSWKDPLPYLSGVDGGWSAMMDVGPDVPERQPIFQKDLEILQGTLDLLKEKGQGQQGQPWAICASFVLPHPPFKARSDILDTYKGCGDLPHNHTGEGRDTCDRYLQQFNGNVKNLPEKQIKYSREVYFALITEFDEYAGRIMDALEEQGLAEDTVVLYFSDHGEMAGEHGLWGKVTLLESSVRVPIIARWPKRFKAGLRADTPVSLVDLYPTFLDLAGIRMPEELSLSGHSLMPLLNGSPQDFKGRYVFGEFEGEGWNHPRAFMRQGNLKYVYNYTAESRLFDLEADPGETNDLSNHPDYVNEIKGFEKELFSFWDPEDIERRVIRDQIKGQISRNKNVCKDLGW